MFTEKELRARADVSFELYAKTINIEALTMIDMAGRISCPPSCAPGELARAAREVESARRGRFCAERCSPASTCFCVRPATRSPICASSREEGRRAHRAEQARYAHDVICPAMEVLRAPVDHLEMIVDGKLLADADHGDLLFNV